MSVVAPSRHTSSPILGTGVPLPPSEPSSRFNSNPPSVAPSVKLSGARTPVKALKAGPVPGEGDPTTECQCVSGGRNLIVCIDGTSNKFGEKNTNVVELYSRLVKDKNQLTYYNSGIGTYATPSWKSLSYYGQKLVNKLDLAFALRFEKIIISAYAWLAENHNPGDRIFLFGFSRGAYQVRALSAMIQRLGLIHKGNDDQIPFAYELYAAGNDVPPAGADTGSEGLQRSANVSPPPQPLGLQPVSPVPAPHPTSEDLQPTAGIEQPVPSGNVEQPSSPQTPGSASATMRTWLNSVARAIRLPATTKEAVGDMQARFKEAFARPVWVHFVGAWDTVSSVGIARSKTLPGTTNGMGHVCFFRHALAIHEFRVKFLPEYANGGLGPLRAGPVSQKTSADVNAPDSAQVGTGLESEIPSSTNDASASDEDASRRRARPRAKEVWFPGSHSDIGGGAKKNAAMKNFGPSLRWMSFEARVAGARFKKEQQLFPDSDSPITRSLKPSWRILEMLPLGRLTYLTPEGTTHWPHWARSRVFQEDQLLSWDVSQRDKMKFKIKDMKVEKDPYTDAENLRSQIDGIQKGQLTSQADLRKFRESLRSIIVSVPGQQSLRGGDRDIVWEFLKTVNKPEIAKDELRDLLLSAIFGLVFAFDGTDTQGIGRHPQLAVRDFFQAVDRHVSSATPLDEGETKMFKVLTELRAGRVALRKESPRAVSAVHRILTEIPETNLNLFNSVKAILAIDGVACPFDAFDANNAIIKPDRCDVIAVGCALLEVIERCIATKTLPQAREQAMLKFMERIDQYRARTLAFMCAALMERPAAGPLVSSITERLSPQLLDLLGLLREKCEEQGPVDAAQEMIVTVRSILDGSAFVMDKKMRGARRLYAILGSPSNSHDIAWTVPQIRGHKGVVTAVAFIHGGDRVASASWDNTVRIWNVHTGIEVFPSALMHDDDVNCIAVQPPAATPSAAGDQCSGRMVSGSDDGICIVWDADNGTELGRSHALGNVVYSLSVSPSGRNFAAGTHDGTIYVLEMDHPSAAPILLPPAHDSPVFSVAYSPSDENILASSCCHFTVLWDLKEDPPKHQTLRLQDDWVRSVAFSPDGKSLATVSDDGLIHIWNVGEASLIRWIPTTVGQIYSVAYAPSCRHIVTGSSDAAVRLWDTETGTEVGEPLWGHDNEIFSVAISQTGARIVSGSADRMICIWDRVPFRNDSAELEQPQQLPGESKAATEGGGRAAFETRSHSV